MKKRSILCAPLALIIVVITSLLFGGLAVSADGETSGSCGDNATWSYADGTLTISGYGAMTDYSNASDSPWYQYRSAITTVLIGDDITHIGSWAFNDYYNLSSVSMGSSVKSIGYSAFFYCEKVEVIDFPETLESIDDYGLYGTGIKKADLSNTGLTQISSYAFYDCNNLESVVLPSSIKTIKNHAFGSCNKLSSVTLNAGLVTIESDAFYYTPELKSIVLPSTLEFIGYEAFYESGLASINIPTSVTTLGSRSFCCCRSLCAATVTLNADMEIGQELFSGCSSLVQANISGTLTSIPYSCFNYCEKLAYVSIPDTVKDIYGYAFHGCESLTSITLPSSLENISEHAFNNCTKLSSITIPNGVTTIGYSAFDSTGLTSVVLPDSVTTVGSSAFASCSNLKEITLSSNMTVIPEYFLSGSSSLESITIPASVTTIESDAFYYSGLTTITIPGTVQTIKREAFDSCPDLKYVEIQEGTLTLGTIAFNDCKALETVVFPASICDLGYDPFCHCTALKTIICHNANFLTTLRDMYPNSNVIDADGLVDSFVVGHSITLTGDIVMNFYVRLPEGYDNSNTDITLTWGDPAADYSHEVKGKLVSIDEYGANYKVSCGVAARAMGDTITLVIKCGDNTLIEDEYSVIDYINVLVRTHSSDYELQNLLTAMVDYGTASQEYFGYHTDDLVKDYFDASAWNEEVSIFRQNLKSTLQNTTDPYDYTIKDIENDDLGIEYYGASALCSSETKMRFYFIVKDEAKFASLTASCKSKNLKFSSKTFRTSEGNVNTVYLETPGLFAGELEEPISVTIGGKSYTYDYKDYMQRCSSNFKDTSIALYAFSHYAKEYQGG